MLAQNDQSYTTAKAMDDIRQKISRIQIEESNKQLLQEINEQIKEALDKLNPPMPIIQEDDNISVDNPQQPELVPTINERQTLKQKLQAMCEKVQLCQLKKEQYQQLHEQIEKLNNRLNATLTNVPQNANNENTLIHSVLQYIDDALFVFRRVDSQLYDATDVLQKLAKLTNQISQPEGIIPPYDRFFIPDINDYQVTLEGLDQDIKTFQTELITQCLKSKNMDITVELLKNGDLPLSVCSQLLSKENWFSRKFLSIFTKSACLQSRINAEDLMLFVNYETNKCIAINPDDALEYNVLEKDDQLKPEIKQKLQEICPQGLPNTVFAPSGSDYHKAIPETGTGQHVILSNMPHHWFWATKKGSAQRAEKYQKVLHQLTSVNKTLVSGHKDGCFLATKIATQLKKKGHDILGLKLIEPNHSLLGFLQGPTEQDIEDELHDRWKLNSIEVIWKHKPNPANNATQAQQPQANNWPQYNVDLPNNSITITTSDKTSDEVIKEQYNSTGTLLTIPEVKDITDTSKDNTDKKKAYKYTKYRIFNASDFPDNLSQTEQIIVNPETNDYIKVSYHGNINTANNNFLEQIHPGTSVEICTPPKSLLENILQGTSFEIDTRVQQENEINNQPPIPQDNQDNWKDVINFMISKYTNHSPKQLNLNFNYKNLENDTLREVIFTPKEIKYGKQKKKEQEKRQQEEQQAQEQFKKEAERQKKEEEKKQEEEEQQKKEEELQKKQEEEQRRQQEEQLKKEEERRKENAKNNITTIINVVKKENSNIKEEKNNADQMNKERENNQANKENKNIPDNAKANEENENNLQENNQEENDIQFTQILQEDNQNNRLQNKPEEKNNTNDDKNRSIQIDSSSKSEDQKQIENKPEEQKQEENEPERKEPERKKQNEQEEQKQDKQSERKKQRETSKDDNIKQNKWSKKTNQNTLGHKLKKDKKNNNNNKSNYNNGRDPFFQTSNNFASRNKLALAGNDIVKNLNKKGDNIFKYGLRSSYNQNNQDLVKNNPNLSKKNNNLTNSLNRFENNNKRGEMLIMKENRTNKKGAAKFSLNNKTNKVGAGNNI